MSDISSTLREASEKNTKLLTILAQTDYAPTKLKQNTEYISDLKSQLASTEKELKQLHTITEDERKDHVKYRDSTVRRFAHKLGGSKGKDKFASKQEKEEREFLEAWQREREAKERKGELETALRSAESDKTGLDKDAERQQKAQKELDAMYHSIFSGPTPDVPGEDQQEESVRQAKEQADQCQAQLNSERYALGALQTADQSLKAALVDMSSAQDASTWDMWGGGGWADMMERNSLSKAQMKITEGQRHIEEARRTNPRIENISDIQLPHGHIMSDVLFDNIFSDMAQHDRIKDGDRQLRQAVGQLDAMIKRQDSLLKDRMSQMQSAGRELDGARRQLQNIRAEAFGRLAGGDVPSMPEQSQEAPPAYAT